MPCCSLLRHTLWIAAVLALPMPASAHAVRHTVQHTTATVVTFRYDDGQAFAHAPFEATPEDATQATVTGSTDATGRAVIVTDHPGRWRLRAFSEDGHGAVVEFDAPPTVPLTAQADARAPAQVPPWVPGLAGLGVLAAVFAALQWGLRRRRRSA